MPIPHREDLAVDRELKPLCALRAEGGHIDDGRIHRTIEPPLADAHRLWEQQASGEHSEADRRRHAELTATLDTCWDEPGGASARDGSVAESYEESR